MQRFFAISAIAGLCLSVQPSFGQSISDANAKISPHYQSERIALASAPIKTRDDLVRYLQEPSPNNALYLLSADARQRLLDSITVNKAGEISSYRISDIQRELTPSQAARVFSLFGSPEMASRVNNGVIKTELDRQILLQKDSLVHPNLTGYYCNGNELCQVNEQSNCVEDKCQYQP